MCKKCVFTVKAYQSMGSPSKTIFYLQLLALTIRGGGASQRKAGTLFSYAYSRDFLWACTFFSGGVVHPSPPKKVDI